MALKGEPNEHRHSRGSVTRLAWAVLDSCSAPKAEAGRAPVITLTQPDRGARIWAKAAAPKASERPDRADRYVAIGIVRHSALLAIEFVAKESRAWAVPGDRFYDRDFGALRCVWW